MAATGFRTSFLVFLLSVTSNLFGVETEITRHQVYGHRDGMALYYDVETPAEANGLGIVLVVSGGFVSGEDNLTISKPFWNVLLENGYTLFQIYHPAMPVYRIPDAFDALKVGVQHIKANSESFGVNNERLGIIGISSGGHLALLLGMSVEAAARSATDFNAIVALMPIVDVNDTALEEELFGARFLDFDPALIPVVSPVNYVSPDDPPTLLIHGTRDQAVNYEKNSVRMQALLNEAGVENKLLSVDAGHEVFPEPLLGETHSAILEWFERHL